MDIVETSDEFLELVVFPRALFLDEEIHLITVPLVFLAISKRQVVARRVRDMDRL